MFGLEVVFGGVDEGVGVVVGGGREVVGGSRGGHCAGGWVIGDWKGDRKSSYE